MRISLLSLTFPFALLACSSETTSTKNQLITCETDPQTGVILSCQPGGDDGGTHSCQDVDTDGDGEPHDGIGDDDGTPDQGGGNDDDGDSDGDGISDDDDCDHHPGEDSDDDSDGLPYDVRPALGSTTAPVLDAFAERGTPPAAILSITGASWRLAELQAGTPFVVTADDCNHAGNRDVGRDRVIVTWNDADGSFHADHLDIRYCKD